MNETTILEKRPAVNGQQVDKNEGNAWKLVTLGGVSGILMGAGAMYAGQASAKEPDVEEVSKVEAPEAGETSHTLENGLKVAAVSDDLSFGEAFEQARAEVGPGGVFHWHGGIYNTYSADEWNAMTIEQKHDFAQQVQPEIHPDDLSTPTDANTQVVIVHHVYQHEEAPAVQEVHQAATEQDDVHIVSTGEYQGHAVVGLDLDGDNQPDVAVIDVDDNYELSDADVVVTRDGDVATIGDITNPNNDDVSVVSDEVLVEPDLDGDVHVVGHTMYEGYDVYAVDYTGDNQADVAFIDVDGDGGLSNPDVVFDGEGNYATVEDIVNAADPFAASCQTDNFDSIDSSDGMDSDMLQSV